jgi:hypothetical protein
MADIPFSISPATGGTSGGLAGVLGQLQGARVAVTTASGRTSSGSILTVEERRRQDDPQKPVVTTHALVIASEGGELQSFDLSEVRAVRLLDEGTRRDVGEFAAASASARRRDAKTITVTSDGAGAREMLVSYTVAAPIWKTTYRVVLDDELKGAAYRAFHEARSEGEPDRYARLAVAHAQGLYVDGDRFVFPDVRLDVQDRDGTVRTVDLELVTKDYHRGQLSAKAGAGFRMFGGGSGGSRGGTPQDPHHVERLIR